MIDAILRILLRCSHRRLTRPFTPVGHGLTRNRTYVVCLDCGTRVGYDWDRMHLRSRSAYIQSAGFQVEMAPRKANRITDVAVSEAVKAVVERARG